MSSVSSTSRVQKLLEHCHLAEDGIYDSSFDNHEQADEIKLRTEVAAQQSDDYLKEIAIHHSIPVMDAEVKKFLNKIPQDGHILDMGGCWGWHWRLLGQFRPDVKVLIIDFVRENLSHAKNLLKDQINQSVFLIHADATQLPFADNSLDGYWTVQALQHIPDFKKAVDEAYRVLKKGAPLWNYSLNHQALVKLIYKVFGKKYHTKGLVDKTFYLERLSDEQLSYVAQVFGKQPKVQYSEILFKPELNFAKPGDYNLFGKIDTMLTSRFLFSTIARQKSFEATK